ncbi:MAG: metallophosphoesterase [Haliscomenobacter sp.]|uniref:metallophosphoesterase family protein n=1 Tax=Haliscomenobacter sp. TaxID=2717303 RepID=UPI0029B74B7B|nr:metallophosphoesterase [Haliscomenobacter sp.]MDX2069367.1 metallophosphoesterase [Haliscomenobacter sp.]
MQRRTFLKNTAAITIPFLVGFSLEKTQKIRIGLIADIHKDAMYDADDRLTSFLKVAQKRKPDFILQMGDFCQPVPKNQHFLNLWNAYPGPKYHLLGNHDMDGGFTREQTRSFYGIQQSYYSFDLKGFHFVFLDGNDPNPKPWAGYNRLLGTEQLSWLQADLEKTKLSTLIFSHQTLEDPLYGVHNAKEVQKMLENVNEQSGFTKVIACLSGHNHTNYLTQINGIHYCQINSASYRWVGEQYQRVRLSEAMDKQYPILRNTIPYKDPLFTFLEIDPAKGLIHLEEKVSAFVGPGPAEMGIVQKVNDPITAQISGFEMEY